MYNQAEKWGKCRRRRRFGAHVRAHQPLPEPKRCRASLATALQMLRHLDTASESGEAFGMRGLAALREASSTNGFEPQRVVGFLLSAFCFLLSLSPRGYAGQ